MWKFVSVVKQEDIVIQQVEQKSITNVGEKCNRVAITSS